MKPCNSAPPPPEKTSKSNEIKQALLVARSGYPCFQPFMVNGSFFKKLPNQSPTGVYIRVWYAPFSIKLVCNCFSDHNSWALVETEV